MIKINSKELKINEAKIILLDTNSKRKLKIVVQNLLQDLVKDDFYDSEVYLKFELDYSDLFKFNYQFTDPVSGKISTLFKLNGKKKEAPPLIVLKKNMFFKRMNEIKESKEIYSKELSNNEEDVFKNVKNKEFVETEFQFGYKKDRDHTYLLINDIFPKEFNSHHVDLLFMDIPYHNQYNHYDLAYNYPIDLDILSCSIFKHYENNRIKNCNFIVFADIKQLTKLEELLTLEFQKHDKTLTFEYLVFFKNQKNMDFLALPKKGFMRSSEHFLLFTVADSFVIHKLNHNNLEKAFDFDKLSSKMDEVVVSLTTSLSIAKKLEDLKEALLTATKNHFKEYNKHLSGSTVFISPMLNKIKASDKDVLNRFEKPYLLLNNIVNSFSADNSTVHEWCFGSGSLAIVCFDNKRSYQGFDKNARQFQGAKDRLKNSISLTFNFISNLEIVSVAQPEKNKTNETEFLCVICSKFVSSKDKVQCERCKIPHYMHQDCRESCEGDIDNVMD